MSATRNTSHAASQSEHDNQQTDSLQPTIATEPADIQSYDTVVIYSDGSYEHQNDLSGVGFRLETNTGDVIHEEWEISPSASSSMETEAAAALLAVRTAKLYSPSYIVLYSDCAPLVDRLSQCEARSELRAQYLDIHDELETVEHTSITHIPRERNRRADELAHLALRTLREQSRA